MSVEVEAGSERNLDIFSTAAEDACRDRARSRLLARRRRKSSRCSIRAACLGLGGDHAHALGERALMRGLTTRGASASPTYLCNASSARGLVNRSSNALMRCQRLSLSPSVMRVRMLASDCVEDTAGAPEMCARESSSRFYDQGAHGRASVWPSAMAHGSSRIIASSRSGQRHAFEIDLPPPAPATT